MPILSNVVPAGLTGIIERLRQEINLKYCHFFIAETQATILIKNKQIFDRAELPRRTYIGKGAVSLKAKCTKVCHCEPVTDVTGVAIRTSLHRVSAKL